MAMNSSETLSSANKWTDENVGKGLEFMIAAQARFVTSGSSLCKTRMPKNVWDAAIALFQEHVDRGTSEKSFRGKMNSARYNWKVFAYLREKLGPNATVPSKEQFQEAVTYLKCSTASQTTVETAFISGFPHASLHKKLDRLFSGEADSVAREIISGLETAPAPSAATRAPEAPITVTARPVRRESQQVSQPVPSGNTHLPPHRAPTRLTPPPRPPAPSFNRSYASHIQSPRDHSPYQRSPSPCSWDAFDSPLQESSESTEEHAGALKWMVKTRVAPRVVDYVCNNNLLAVVQMAIDLNDMRYVGEIVRFCERKTSF